MGIYKQFLDWSGFTTPGSAIDLRLNGIRKALEYDTYGNQTVFKAIALTDAWPLNAAAADQITGGGFLAGPAVTDFIFKGRILGDNSPHGFLPDPCDPTQAGDSAKAMSLVKMHTSFVSTADSELEDNSMVKQGDIIWVELKHNVFSYDLQYGKFIKKSRSAALISSEDSEEESCRNLSGLEWEGGWEGVQPRTLDPKTYNMNSSMYPPPVVVAAKALNHPMHEDGQVNIIGIRSAVRQGGSFDDHIWVAWKQEAFWHSRKYRATTDPGLPTLEEGAYAAEGRAAILVPGSYPVYKFDFHGRDRRASPPRPGYRTLCQRNGSVRTYRDDNRDQVLNLDPSTITEGSHYGINIHHAGGYSGGTVVGLASAGCQVFQKKEEWAEAMDIAARSGAEIFTYTLMNESDAPNV